MIFYANCKINLGLRILGKRADVLHNIDSILYPINFSDIIEIVPNETFIFTHSGIELDFDLTENLCVKAFNLMKDLHNIPNIKMHLHKRIPMGAGLGGGSADAAFTLKNLNHLFDLKLDNQTLKEYAAKLGSDCPFFIDNITARATETGTTLEKIELDLKSYFLILLFPNYHVSTAEAYSGIFNYSQALDLDYLKLEKIKLWKDILVNDFEMVIFEKHQQLKSLKNQLYDMGAIYASMTGSGSSIYGIFKGLPKVQFNNVDYKIVSL